MHACLPRRSGAAYGISQPLSTASALHGFVNHGFEDCTDLDYELSDNFNISGMSMSTVDSTPAYDNQDWRFVPQACVVIEVGTLPRPQPSQCSTMSASSERTAFDIISDFLQTATYYSRNPWFMNWDSSPAGRGTSARSHCE